jgi:hypothetical protein
MPRKTTGNGTPGRSKKTAAPTPTPAMQVVAEARNNLLPINLEDEIRRRAYEIYLQRGSTPGDEHADWLTAEREIRDRYQQAYTA